MYKQTLEKIYSVLSKKYFYRSKREKKINIKKFIYALNNIKKVEKFTQFNIKVARPALGVCPVYCDRLINGIFATNIKKFLTVNINISKKLKII